MKKAIVLGTGSFGELVNFYLENDSDYTVIAFCASEASDKLFCGKSVFSFEGIENLFPPDDYEFFVAIGYRKMNAMRKDFCDQARAKGYKLLSYISSKATYWDAVNQIGENVFIFEDNTIQPFVKIGDGAVLWSGNHIGHHSKIGNYCFISSHVVISGFCNIGDFCFLGVNSTLSDDLTLGDNVLIGSGAYVSKSVEENRVVIAETSKTIKILSNKLLR